MFEIPQEAVWKPFKDIMKVLEESQNIAKNDN